MVKDFSYRLSCVLACIIHTCSSSALLLRPISDLLRGLSRLTFGVDGFGLLYSGLFCFSNACMKYLVAAPTSPWRNAALPLASSLLSYTQSNKIFKLKNPRVNNTLATNVNNWLYKDVIYSTISVSLWNTERM